MGKLPSGHELWLADRLGAPAWTRRLVLFRTVCACAAGAMVLLAVIDWPYALAAIGGAGLAAVTGVGGMEARVVARIRRLHGLDERPTWGTSWPATAFTVRNAALVVAACGLLALATGRVGSDDVRPGVVAEDPTCELVDTGPSYGTAVVNDTDAVLDVRVTILYPGDFGNVLSVQREVSVAPFGRAALSEAVADASTCGSPLIFAEAL